MILLITLLKLLSILICISLTKATVAWTIEIQNSSSIQAMNKGFYYSITVEFKLNEDEIPLSYPTATIKLKNDDQAIFTPQDSYSIDLGKERTLHILIGSKCNTRVTSTTISFIVDKDQSNFKSIEYPITLTDANPFQLSVGLSSSTLSKGEYGLLFFNEYPKNTEPIEFTIWSTNTALTFDTLKLPIYNIAASKSTINAKYYRSLLETIDMSATIEVSLASASLSKCFALSKSSYTISLGSNTIKSTKGQAVSFKYNIPGSSSLEISMLQYISPSVLFCSIISSQYAFPSKEDILKQDYSKNNSILRYFKGFFFDGLSISTIILEELNRIETYKLRCIYQNTAHEVSLLTSSSFSSSKNISIEPKITPTSYCLTWFVDKPIDKAAFDDGLIKNCNFALSNFVPLSNNGCLDCFKRPSNDLFDLKPNTEMTSVCIGSNPTCSSASSEQAIEKSGNNFFLMGENEAVIERIMKLKVKFSEPIFKEYSMLVLPTEYIITESNHNEKSYQFTFNVNTQIPNKCTLELYSLNKEIKDIQQSVFLLKRGEKKEIDLAFPYECYDDDTYAVKVLCSPFPNFPYSSSIIQFDSSPIVHNKTVNCLETPYVSNCVSVNYVIEPKLITDNPKENIDMAISQFKASKLPTMQNFYITNLPFLQSEANSRLAFKMVQAMSELMIYMNCNKFLFNSCRSTKKIAIREIMKRFTQIYPKGVFIRPQDEVEAQAKMFLIGMMYTTMNIDGYFNQTSRDVINYVGLALNDSSALLEIFNDVIKNRTEEYITNAQNDMMKMYLTIVDNILNLVEYLQRDGNVLFNQSPYSIINQEEAIGNFKYAINGLISSILKDITTPWTSIVRTYFDIFIYKVQRDKQDSSLTILETNTFNITLPIKAIIDKTKAGYVAIIAYQKHPQLTFNNSNVYSSPVIDIELFNAEYKVIPHSELPGLDFTIGFKLENAKSLFAYCYYLSNWNLSVDNMYISQHTSTVTSCKTNKLLGDILIGSFEMKNKDTDAESNSNKKWIIVGSVIGGVVLIIIIVCIVLYVRKRKEDDNVHDLSQFDINEPKDNEVIAINDPYSNKLL